MKQGKKKHLWRSISITLILSLVFTSIPAMAFAAESENGVETEQTQGASKELDDVTKDDVIEEESSEYVTAFDLGGGQKAKVISGYPVRYEDENGQMKEVDPSLSPVTDTNTTEQGVSLTGYAYENEAGEFKQYLPDAMSENSPVRMEYGDYAITMTPTGYLNGLLNRDKKVQCDEEEFTDLYGEVKKKKVKAIYESIDDSAFLEYTSLHDGLKESIILNEKPKKNEFSYKLTLTGLAAEVKEDGSIVFCDKISGEIVASMEAPFMNDASGEAYSEDITCKLKKRGNSDQYTLTLTVDESYLADENRQYPVAIDPTATWVGTAKIHDAYIVSSSPNYNYYQSDTRIMPSGCGSSGSKYRTCINVIGVRSELLDCNITSAYFDIYETANGNANKAVRIYKILEEWAPSKVTWNTCPDFGTAASYLDENFSTGTTNKKMRFDVTSWVEGIAAGGSNRGIMLKNKTETSTTYTEFYGSRTSATSYRPKLIVTYTEDKPTTATSVTASKSGYNVGESISVSWEGIKANNLDHIEYRVAKYDADGTLLDDYYVPYTRLTSAKPSGSATIPNSSSFPQGRYGIYIRGVSASGVNGTGKRSPIVTISKDKPTTPTSVSFSPNPCPEGHKITASWSGLVAGELKSIQYRVASYDDEWNQVKYAYVPYTTLSVSPTSSGSVVLPDSDTWETGNYKVFIRGVSAAGVTGTGKGSSVVIEENGEPTIDTLSVSIGGTSDASGYVKPGNVTVTADKIFDEDVITASDLSYSLYGPNDSQVGVSLSSSTVHSNSDGSYRVSFSIPQSAVSASGTYTLYFWVFDKAGNLGYISKSFNIDATAPTGSIHVTDVPYGNETAEITSLAKITASVNDAHSGARSSALSIYKGTKDNPGEKVKDLYTNSSIKKIVDFDAEAYENGSYCLKLTIEDKVGNTETVWHDITIAKPMEKPIVGVKMDSGSKELSVSWGFQQEKQELAYIQYNLDDSSNWIDVKVTDKLKGIFTVALDEQMTGTHSIKVRGVDDTGAPGEAARVDFNIDTIAPTVQILGISQGIVLGTITDDNLASWTISIKAKEDETAEFVETASGTKTVSNGRIALSGLSDEQFAAGVWYTVKVEARDHAGNVASDTFDILKNATDTYAQMIPTEHRILRSLGQSMQENHFLVSRTEDRLQMEDSNLFTSAAWFVDGELVSEEKDYKTDFSVFEEDKRYGIAAAGKDAAGALYYTGDIYVGGTVLYPDLVQTETGDLETVIPFVEQTVGFILEEGSVPEGTIWYAKTENGEYQQITPGELTYFLNINNHSLAPSLVTIKAVAPDGYVIEDTAFTLQLAVMDQETFSVSAAEDYYPENVSAQDKINYKTYVRWELPETIPEGLSYEVHRSTIENFTPGDATLAAENVTDSYWCDINTNYSISLYYKVRAVIKDESGKIISASSYSATAESTPIDKNEYQKALGHKEYWAYADIATPSGSGYIEKSQGNFVYEQTDGEIANEQLAVALTRTYNSMATSKSAFGYGWTHNYDIELLKLGKDSSLEEGILVLRDGSGTLYQFKEDGDTYISSLGKYVTLTKENKTQSISLSDPAEPNTVETITVHTAYTMKTRDNMVYYFDDSGKLVWMEESNGNLLLFHYDEKRGLLDKITTGNNISVTFTYKTMQ